ncbi:rhodanese-like domain-containing protein [Prolixibacteraceae bacterium Z1-6]|uniref:Rhodanese-like domain-containing protein n=1 Tax=Draconibacterium aestuarii TaxID=2998507 RepID=A0A9X3FD00_9BACT|nr:rhodanese-like domain-containing protein [Prolixibacteraceae bacterium Z1-6]
MHIHELNPWRTLIALSVFVVLLIVGFLTMKKPLMSYQLNMTQSVEELTESEAYFFPWELEGVINKETTDVVLFDIRNNFVFGQGHIPGAENISANNLSSEENIARLEELKKMNVTVVLYGDDELHANGPWMLFRQVGYDNVKLLLGGYKYYFEHKEDLAATIDDDGYYIGFPRHNYAEMAAPKDGSAAGTSNERQEVQVQRRKKTVVAAGGC